VSGADRSSAEVIIEPPCCTDSGGTLPLTDFGTISNEDNVSSLAGGENSSATWVRSN
jgi:hypothetical protein